MFTTTLKNTVMAATAITMLGSASYACDTVICKVDQIQKQKQLDTAFVQENRPEIFLDYHNNSIHLKTLNSLIFERERLAQTSNAFVSLCIDAVGTGDTTIETVCDRGAKTKAYSEKIQAVEAGYLENVIYDVGMTRKDYEALTEQIRREVTALGLQGRYTVEEYSKIAEKIEEGHDAIVDFVYDKHYGLGIFEILDDAVDPYEEALRALDGENNIRKEP